MTAATHVFTDSRTLLRRNLLHALRYPSMSLSTLMMPLIFLLLFTYAFGSTLGSPLYLDYLDINGDGAINGLDFAAYRGRFGTSLP